MTPGSAVKVVGVDRFMLAAESLPLPFYQEFAPPRDLAEFVACSWARVVRSGGGASEPILPDGCADIMVFDDEAPRVAGPDAVTRRTAICNGAVIVGIRLRPGACRAVFGCSAADIVNGGAWLHELVPGAGELHRRLNCAGTLSSRVAVLESWVRDALVDATPNDRAVIVACRLLGAGSKRDVGDVARQLGWNARMIHRQFVAACGYSPKHFQRIMRIQQVLRLAAARPGGQLADLAAAAGFADQAHMTRDFRNITGFTPGAYLEGHVSPGWSAWIREGW